MTGKSWNRALAVFNTVIAAAMWPLFLILALRDWTLIIVPLVVTAGVTLQWVGLRMTYVPERPRPDYSAIAAMEREVYGEMFRHEGAPGRAVSRPETRWDGRTTHPDTTRPAAIEDYVLWLQGYVKRGGKPTHFYDYPFSQAGFRYASTPLTVDSDYEYGSSLRHIIVAKDVTTKRTNPAGSFGGWAHTKCYFMHGYRTNDSIIPVYSDPEFDAIREQFADQWTARSPGALHASRQLGDPLRAGRRDPAGYPVRPPSSQGPPGVSQVWHSPSLARTLEL